MACEKLRVHAKTGLITRFDMAAQDAMDLLVIGGGSGGLSALDFALSLGARCALVEKDRIGGDCTWTGCVPSKSLLRVARNAREVRLAAQFGVNVGEPTVEMARVRDYIQQSVRRIAQAETPEKMRERGIQTHIGAARFLDNKTVEVGGQRLTAKKFIVATGARPTIPDIPGLKDADHHTYETIFENDRLPEHLIVIGGGPIACEIGQAYRFLGAQVTLIAQEGLLERHEPEARDLLTDLFQRDGVEIVQAKAERVDTQDGRITVIAGGQQITGDMLLVAVGRAPVVRGLDLESAGVEYTAGGITVNDSLQTTAPSIYAVGDCLGGPQFTHYAGWQAFHAVRSALLPGKSKGKAISPQATFTMPEVAMTGLTEADAREQHGDKVRADVRPMTKNDRGIAERETEGFVKLVYKGDTILGATLVCPTAGDAINEWTLAIHNGIKLADFAGAIHIYPTYSTASQQVAAEVALKHFLESAVGKIALRLGM